MQKTVSLKELPGTFISSGMTLPELCEYLNVSVELINEWERFFNLFPETGEQKEKVYSKQRIKDFIKIKDSYEKGTPLHEIRRRLFKASVEEVVVPVATVEEKTGELPILISASSAAKSQPAAPVIEPAKQEQAKAEISTPKFETVKKEAVANLLPKAASVKTEEAKIGHAEIAPAVEAVKKEEIKAETVAKSEPVIVAPVKAEPVKQEEVKKEPVSSLLPAAEPVKKEEVKAEAIVAKAEPAVIAPVKAEPVKQEEVKKEPVSSLLPAVESAKKEEVKPEAVVAKAEPAVISPVKSEPVKKEEAKVEAPKQEEKAPSSNLLLASKPEKVELPALKAEPKAAANPFAAKTNTPDIKAIVDELVDKASVQIAENAINPFLTQLNKANEKIGELILEKARLVEETAIEKANLISEIKILNSKNVELLAEKETLFITIKEKEQEIKRSHAQETLLAESLKISQVMLSQKEEEIAYIKGRIETYEQQLQEKDNIIQAKNLEIEQILEKQNKRWWHSLRDIFF